MKKITTVTYLGQRASYRVHISLISCSRFPLLDIFNTFNAMGVAVGAWYAWRTTLDEPLPIISPIDNKTKFNTNKMRQLTQYINE